MWIDLLKPTSFTPVLALVGIILYMSCKSGKRKDTGVILLGFATLMFGMDTMSGAVAGLKDVPAFAQLFVAFKNPVLGVLVAPRPLPARARRAVPRLRFRRRRPSAPNAVPKSRSWRTRAGPTSASPKNSVPPPPL